MVLGGSHPKLPSHVDFLSERDGQPKTASYTNSLMVTHCSFPLKFSLKALKGWDLTDLGAMWHCMGLVCKHGLYFVY